MTVELVQCVAHRFTHSGDVIAHFDVSAIGTIST